MHPMSRPREGGAPNRVKSIALARDFNDDDLIFTPRDGGMAARRSRGWQTESVFLGANVEKT